MQKLSAVPKRREVALHNVKTTGSLKPNLSSVFEQFKSAGFHVMNKQVFEQYINCSMMLTIHKQTASQLLYSLNLPV